MANTCGGVSLTPGFYGCVPDPKNNNATQQIQKFTWQNSHHIVVEVINFGATITRILIPDKRNNLVDIVQGFDSLAGYQDKGNVMYHGGTMGRVANRIRDGKFEINGEKYNVSKNVQCFHLHGGFIGFNKVVWNTHVEGSRLILTYLSKDGEEGFPGDLLVTIQMELMENDEFVVDMSAVTARPTPVNLANHTYFNLAGHDAGAGELMKHRITINSHQVTETDDLNIPTGNIVDITNTCLDLQTPSAIGCAMNKLKGKKEGMWNGFDHNYVIRGYDPAKPNERVPKFVASVYHPASGRVMEIYSDQPGCQFYTGNNLQPENEELTNVNLMGKHKGPYVKHSAFCLETQNFPNAVNIPTFPNSILYPGEVYRHCFTYKFRVQD